MMIDSKFKEDMFVDDMGMSTDANETKASKDDQHKLMTMDDVAKELKEDFPEEISDCKKYLCMAKIAENADNLHDSHYLLEMAKDEFTHAYFIYDFMKRHEMYIPEEHKRCFMELKEEMAEFF